MKFLLVLYSALCLLLALIYQYYPSFYLVKIQGYSAALWAVLAVNIVLIAGAVVSFKKAKLLSVLSIVLSPVSVYLFYQSWVNINYQFLAGFLFVPIILLVISLFLSFKKIKI
jgi:hypothetical protein